MRCALGWALHDETEIARCAVTGSVAECWKADPDLVAAVPGPTARLVVARESKDDAEEIEEIDRIAGD